MTSLGEISAVIVEQHFKANKDFFCQQRDCGQCLPSGFYPFSQRCVAIRYGDFIGQLAR